MSESEVHETRLRSITRDSYSPRLWLWDHDIRGSRSGARAPKRRGSRFPHKIFVHTFQKAARRTNRCTAKNDTARRRCRRHPRCVDCVAHPHDPTTLHNVCVNCLRHLETPNQVVRQTEQKLRRQRPHQDKTTTSRQFPQTIQPQTLQPTRTTARQS